MEFVVNSEGYDNIKFFGNPAGESLCHKKNITLQVLMMSFTSK